MVDSVLMLTTLGPNCLAICENWLESCFGEGTASGVASEDFCPSLPFTPKETTVPIRMPTASVATMLKEETHRRVFMRTHIACESIDLLSSENCVNPELYLFGMPTPHRRDRPEYEITTKQSLSVRRTNTAFRFMESGRICSEQR